MDAFQSNWSKPYFALNNDCPYEIEDFELLTTILSALKWREKNGGIRMVPDREATGYYRRLGMEPLWDLGLDDSLEVDPEVDPFLLWAAGKLYALRAQTAPCAMIDTDFIVWEPLNGLLRQTPLAVIHREDLMEDIYPDPESFQMREGYRFSPAWDWSMLPCNTAFLWIGDSAFKDYYTGHAISFMRQMAGGDRITGMVFAEQRMLSLCAGERGIPILSLSDLDLLAVGQKRFTHIWGYKDVLRGDAEKRKAFCIRCIKRIRTDFPDWMGMMRGIPQLAVYTEGL